MYKMDRAGTFEQVLTVLFVYLSHICYNVLASRKIFLEGPVCTAPHIYLNENKIIRQTHDVCEYGGSVRNSS